MKRLLFMSLLLLSCSLNEDEDDKKTIDKNFAPEIVSHQSDIRLVYGTQSKTINISQIFNDPDDDKLTYSFSFSKSNFFSTNNSPSEYIVFAFDQDISDSAFVFVEAIDDAGEACSDTFQIIINAEEKINFTIQNSDLLDQISIYAKPNIQTNMSNYSFEWTTTSDKIQFINNQAYSTRINIPENELEFNTTIFLKINKDNSSDSKSKEITIPFLSQNRKYGFGINSQSERSNNRSYDWYFDQMNTGIYSGINCGPTATTMAIMWADENFDKSPEDARNTFRSNGGWWYTTDINNYLALNYVNRSTIQLYSMSLVKEQIDNNNIVILCLDMFYVKANTGLSERRVDKFYSTNSTGWGHFIVIKGYKIVDNQLFYEAYDPYSFGMRYNDNSIKGKNRYYRSEDLNNATNNWWDYAIVVTKSSGKINNALDEKSIPVQKGR